MTRLALSNCSVPEIAAITGHSITTVQEVLDVHYLGDRVELAESAIKKLSEVYGHEWIWDVDRVQVKALPDRQGFCVRESAPRRRGTR